MKQDTDEGLRDREDANVRRHLETWEVAGEINRILFQCWKDRIESCVCLGKSHSISTFRIKYASHASLPDLSKLTGVMVWCFMP